LKGISMKKRFLIPLVAFILALALPTFAASTPKGGIIYTFKGGSDGAYPVAPLVADAKGNLYGTTGAGGAGPNCVGDEGCGTVFELIAPSSPSGQWREAVLYAFTGGSDGAFPRGGLIFDSAGNLYGTTLWGGDLNNTFCVDGTGLSLGCGVAFELSPPARPGQAWTEAVLHAFELGGTDGAYPDSSLVLDGSGNFFGTAESGNLVSNGGVVFELSPAVGGTWTESILYSFTCGSDGCVPSGPLSFDRYGNLYGTTSQGGENNYGAVFQLVPPVGSGQWVENSLLTFDGSNGANPYGGVLLDPSGDLFGTTMNGGVQKDGLAFELVPPQSGDVWTEVILRSFIGGGNAHPFGFVEDASGDLYGTTEGTYADTCGEIFKLSHSAGEWNQTVLHSFNGKHFSQGCTPRAPLVNGKWEALYGTTSGGGDKSCEPNGCGVVFGFLP
jgi:hypothetical protein